VGYHDLTNEGLPLGKVFAGSDMVNGYNWTVTASHELLEMLIDRREADSSTSCNILRQPFEILAGGYINTYDVGAGRGGWQPLNADATPQNHLARGPVGSRRERRRLRRDHWLRSFV
jgi:hypothetical protein